MNSNTMTIKDIAKICGVGVSTVSRAINNHPDINPETKSMIMRVIKENNYIPNNNARNLKRSNSKTIAILIKGITNPFFNPIIKIFEREIKKKKYTLVLNRVEEKEDEVEIAIQLIKEKRLKGIIFLGGQFSHTQEQLQRLDVPFVLSTIGITKKFDKNIYSSVSVDDMNESYKMVNYLCQLGHKKIAIITAKDEDESIGKLRFMGYEKALKANNINLNPKLIGVMREDIESYTMQNGYEVAKKLLQSGEQFTAIYAISDSLAVGACKAVFDLGKKIPDDYSIVGFDGLDIGTFYNPSITTIRQPVEDIARETIKVLFDLIKNGISHKQIIFEGELIKGQSVKCIL